MLLEDAELSIYQVKVDASNMDTRIKRIEKNFEDHIFTWSPPLKEQLNMLCKKWSNPESDGIGMLTYHATPSVRPKLLQFFLNPKK